MTGRGAAALALLLGAALSGPAASQAVQRDLTGERRANAGLPAIADPAAPGAADDEPAPGELRSLFRTAPPPPEGMEAAPNNWTDPILQRPAPTALAADVARLRVLDKMSGAVETFEMPVGGVEERGRLRIELQACRVQPPELPPDAFAWLRITDRREDAPRFAGWMIASSPALSALDHQRYDVWVLSCSTASAETPSESAKKSASR